MSHAWRPHPALRATFSQREKGSPTPRGPAHGGQGTLFSLWEKVAARSADG
jgi:hypothetical protein